MRLVRSIRFIAALTLAASIISTNTFGDETMNARAAQAPKQEDAAPASPEQDWTERNTDPNEIRRGVRMGGENGKGREQASFERVIASVEPDMKGTVDRLPVYVKLFEREFIQDPRMFPVNVKAEAAEDGTINLSGYVGYRENKESLGNLFKYLGFQKVNNNVEVLPSENLGEKKFALVIVPFVFEYDRIEEPRERMNQAFVGDRVFLLKKMESDYYLVQTAEGYVGYIAGEALRPVTSEQFHEYQSGPRVILKRDVEVEGMMLPQGARLKALEKNAEGKAVAVLPTGKEVTIPADAVETISGEVNARVLEALGVAKQIEGTKYVWGGKGSEGVDCSGLVQSAFRAVGVNLARDAYMQAYSGELVATRWDRTGMRAGDLMYFLGGNGKIHHTSIYVGDGIFIEASGTVKYTSLNPGDENYGKKRDESFCFAKRVLE